MKKTGRMLLLVTSLLLLNINSVTAKNFVEPCSPRCTPYKSYTETSVSKSQSEQFTHIVYSSPISSTVTREVTLTSTLTLKTGTSMSMNMLIAKSSINFEMGYAGSRQTKTSIKWNIPAGSTYKLIAGKEIADVTGRVSEMDSYCNLTSKPVSVKGSFRTYSKAIKVN